MINLSSCLIPPRFHFPVNASHCGARTSATAPSTRPPCGPAPPEPARATPTRLWNTTIHVLLQTLNTCTPCLAATPRRAPTPKTAQEIPSPCAERRPRLWPAPGTPHNARAKLQCPACCTCYRVQALVQPRTVLARTAAQPTNEPNSLASPSQPRTHPAQKHSKPEQPTE